MNISQPNTWELLRSQQTPQLSMFLRRGPYGLLAIASLAAGASVPSLGASNGEILIMAVLVVVLGAMHWGCADRRWDHHRLDDTLGTSYVLIRSALAFTITWLNPFFALFALMGYFDYYLYARRHYGGIVLLVTVVTLAGSQSGGLPPGSGMQASLFAVLLAVNGILVLIMVNAAIHETRISNDRHAAIIALQETNTRLEQALAENAQLQAQIVQQAHESGVHEERERLAIEIHDTLAQSITGVITQLEAIPAGIDSHASTDRISLATSLARDALNDARRSVRGLLPTQLQDTALTDALAQLTSDWSTTHAVPAEIVVTGNVTAVHPDIEATVLRVAQEALTNVAKHARARRVGVTLSYTGEELVLDVRDDGIGFAPSLIPHPAGRAQNTSPHGSEATTASSGTATAGSGATTVGEPALDDGNMDGVGLHGIRQRAARVAGELIIEAEPGSGAALSLRVPAVADV